MSFMQSAIIKEPGDRDSSQYTYITDVLRPPELLKDSTKDSVIHVKARGSKGDLDEPPTILVF